MQETFSRKQTVPTDGNMCFEGHDLIDVNNLKWMSRKS